MLGKVFDDDDEKEEKEEKVGTTTVQFCSVSIRKYGVALSEIYCIF